ncbi:hypothetical protein [Mucilaginibacter sp. 10I4]|uniref:hypothetical protein n=1 Tax=Mucilaginibacter sp. 10I4 TaxID=3048580 RepID=UPI002B23DE0E|nr:hypothetical protein [Mucilaginibacter sp. 10I4]
MIKLTLAKGIKAGKEDLNIRRFIQIKLNLKNRDIPITAIHYDVKNSCTISKGLPINISAIKYN